MVDEWESVGLDLYARLGSPRAPLNAFELARDAGFDVVGGLRGRARLVGDCMIQIDETTHVSAQHWQVARELGRWALWCAGMPLSDDAADHVASALLMPTAECLAMLLTALDPEVHVPRCQYVAFELMARRMATLEGAIVTTWRAGRVMRRFTPGYLQPGNPSASERSLAARVRSSPRPIYAEERRAYAVYEGPGGVEVIVAVPAHTVIDLGRARRQHRPAEAMASPRAH
jgi:hypothetical protein